MKLWCVSGPKCPGRRSRRAPRLTLGISSPCVSRRTLELPAGHPKRKCKGRVVFQGNRVTNQSWGAAIFQDLGSCPATMEASRAADCY
eukprot:14593643-Heterocapsa_arctica.AAC.1